MPNQKNVSYYNDFYKNHSKRYLIAPHCFSSFTINASIIHTLSCFDNPKILELGCGTGELAWFLHAFHYINYLGIDFSKIAIEQAQLRCPHSKFLVHNAFDYDFDSWDYEIVILSELLEHLDNDLELINKIPQSKICLISVPSFPDSAHVRFFKQKSDAVIRYSKLFEPIQSLTIAKWFLIYGVKN